MPNKKIYTSSGTVAFVYDSRAGNDRILFTPATHHTIMHGGTNYAVFLRDPPSESRPTAAKMLQLKNGHARIEVDDAGRDVFTKLGPAATASEIGVDIDVHIDGDKLLLRGATVPAKSHTK